MLCANTLLVRSWGILLRETKQLCLISFCMCCHIRTAGLCAGDDSLGSWHCYQLNVIHIRDILYILKYPIVRFCYLIYYFALLAVVSNGHCHPPPPITGTCSVVTVTMCQLSPLCGNLRLQFDFCFFIFSPISIVCNTILCLCHLVKIIKANALYILVLRPARIFRVLGRF